MIPGKRKVWRHRVTGASAIAGLVFAIVSIISRLMGLAKQIPPNLIGDAVLATLSVLLLYILLSSIYHENALDDLARQVEALNKGEITGAYLERAILDRVDMKLRPMFRQHLRSVIAEISAAYERQTVVFSDPLLFKSYYLAVLQAFPQRATLIATSLPLRQYFWDGAIEERMGQFIRRTGRRGVKFKRIFFVGGDAFKDVGLLSQEQADVMRMQLHVGVEVFIHPCNQYPRTLVLSDDAATIAWVVETNDDHTIRRVTATSKPSEVQLHYDSLQNMLAVARPIRAKELGKFAVYT